MPNPPNQIISCQVGLLVANRQPMCQPIPSWQYHHIKATSAGSPITLVVLAILDGEMGEQGFIKVLISTALIIIFLLPLMVGLKIPVGVYKPPIMKARLYMDTPNLFCQKQARSRQGIELRLVASRATSNVHLHLEHIPAGSKPVFDVWLGERGKGGQFGNNVVKDIYYKKSPQHMSAANGKRRSDPTPVMSFDVTLADNGRYTKWLGNTARQQFNLLYSGNLPLGGLRYGSIIPIKKPTVSFPAVTAFKAWDSASAAAANMSSVDAAVSADMAGYDLSGNYISYQALASFIASDNGAQFGSMPSTLLDSDFTKMSMLQITTGIGSHRYGNIDWYKQMSSLSSKGMLTEYLIMNAEENFLRHQNQLLKNRIEMLLAGLTKARMHNYSKKVETLQVLAQAPTIPRIIDRELQVSDDEYVVTGGQGDVDLSNLPNDIQGLIQTLSHLISLHEGASWDSYNNGTTTQNVKNTACPPMESFFTDAQVAKAVARGGVRPSQMTLQQIVDSMKGGVCPRSLKKVAVAGKYQIMHFNIKAYIGKHPQDANKLFTPEMQMKIMNNHFFFGGNGMIGLQNLVKGRGNPEQVKNYISSQWASVCKTNGKGSFAQKCHLENSRAIGVVIDKIDALARGQMGVKHK